MIPNLKIEKFFSWVEATTDRVSVRCLDSETNASKQNVDAFGAYSGEFGRVSLRTIIKSWPQVRLVAALIFWYGLTTFLYQISANLLLYLTLHNPIPDSPSYPGAVSTNRTNPWPHKQLYDLGFAATPDFSNPRPFILKVLFVDLNVYFAQMAPVVFLLVVGRTKRFVCYVGSIGSCNLMKGVVQMITLFPAANGGEVCWQRNFKLEELDRVRNTSFWQWALTNQWGMTHGCNDMLWSGHTAQTCIGFLFVWRTLSRLGAPRFVAGLMITYFLGYMWAVLVLRMHYSVDVVVAVVLGCFVYTHAGFLNLLWNTANRIACNSRSRDCINTGIAEGAAPLSITSDTATSSLELSNLTMSRAVSA